MIRGLDIFRESFQGYEDEYYSLEVLPAILFHQTKGLIFEQQKTLIWF